MIMPKNRIQFQKGFSFSQFQQRFGSEEQCWQALFRIKFPQGFRCPYCNCPHYYRIHHRQGLMCTACKKQLSLRAHTLMQNSKLPFTTWFWAMYLITQSKKSLSSLQLMRHLGVHYSTAWLLQQKIIEGMSQHEQTNILQGVVHVDDGYIGGRQSGVRGRGAAGKIPFITALSFKNNKPDQLKLSLLSRFSKEEIAGWSKRFIQHNSQVFSDALPGFSGLARHLVSHTVVNVTRRPDEKDHLFRSINTIMGNLKRYLLGIHHAVRKNFCARYLSAFAWRFNHRYHLREAFYAGLHTIMTSTPCTCKKLQVDLCR